ncbi:uncharacterized protein LOC144433752 [Glandiceps talaboti]
MARRLFDAVAQAHLADVKILVDLGVKVDCRNSLGQTPLIASLLIMDEQKRDKTFRYLVRRGADVLTEDNQRKTVLLYACQYKRTKQVRRIFNSVGAGSVNLNGQDVDGNTSLIYAVKTQNEELIKLLLRMLKYYHLSVDVPDNDGCTPLIHARKLGLSEIGDLLLNEGKANPYMADNREHWNAFEWTQHAKELENDRLADEKERQRQRAKKFMFPPIKLSYGRIERTRRNRQSVPLNVPLKPAVSLSTLKDESMVTSYSAPETVYSKVSITHRPNSSSLLTKQRRTTSVPSLPLLTDKTATTKSLDSAITLLEMASTQGEHVQHVDNFVSSRPDLTKKDDYFGFSRGGHMTLLNNLFAVYADQSSVSYRRVAQIERPKTPSNSKTGKNKKISSLAIVFGRDKHQQKMQKLAARKGKRGKSGEKDTRGELRSKKTKQMKNLVEGKGHDSNRLPLAIISEDT